MTLPKNHRSSSSGPLVSGQAKSNLSPLDLAERILLAEGVESRYGYCSISSLIEHPDRVKTHSKQQIAKIGRSMEAVGPISPVIIDETCTILAGHARVAGARANGATEVPVLLVSGLTEAKKRLFILADNRIGEDGGLDREKLARQLPELEALLVEAGFELIDTGFEVAQLDELFVDMADDSGDEGETLDLALCDEVCALRLGDLLQLGEHRLLIGDAQDVSVLDILMPDEKAETSFLDPPFNERVRDIGGRGKIRHPEFAFASGEMNRTEYVSFLTKTFEVVAGRCESGSVVYVCIDWKHVRELIEAAEQTFAAYLNLAVWNKTNAGQGGLYRSQHELIGVFRVGQERHRDNVQKGRYGRNRSNVWTYAGVNTFRAGRMEDLAAHPTVKPTKMVVDVLHDVTQRGAIVLDTFAGSGTTILAAEKTGRRARAVEIEPRYAQVAARRWEKMTGRDAIHVASGLTLHELTQSRQRDAAATSVTPPRTRVRTRTPA